MQELPEVERQPGTAKAARAFDPDPPEVHFDPSGLFLGKQTALPGVTRGGFRKPNPVGRVQHPEVGDHSLPRSPLGSVGFHQLPVFAHFALQAESDILPGTKEIEMPDKRTIAAWSVGTLKHGDAIYVTTNQDSAHFMLVPEEALEITALAGGWRHPLAGHPA